MRCRQAMQTHPRGAPWVLRGKGTCLLRSSKCFYMLLAYIMNASIHHSALAHASRRVCNLGRVVSALKTGQKKRDQIENTKRRSQLVCKGVCCITYSFAACLRSAAAVVSTLHVHRSRLLRTALRPVFRCRTEHVSHSRNHVADTKTHDQHWEGELPRSCVDEVHHAVQAVWHAQGSSRGDRASQLLLHSTTVASCTGCSPQAGMPPSAARCAIFCYTHGHAETVRRLAQRASLAGTHMN